MPCYSINSGTSPITDINGTSHTSHTYQIPVDKVVRFQVFHGRADLSGHIHKHFRHVDNVLVHANVSEEATVLHQLSYNVDGSLLGAHTIEGHHVGMFKFSV